MTENSLKETKYIIVKPPLGPPAAILFPATLDHLQMVPRNVKVLSAGFYVIEEIDKDGSIYVFAHGKSTSLDMKCMPGDDRIIIKTILGKDQIS